MKPEPTTQAAALLADLTGLPADHPAITADAARIAPRIAVTAAATLRAELVAEWRDLAGLLTAHIRATVDGRAA